VIAPANQRCQVSASRLA